MSSTQDPQNQFSQNTEKEVSRVYIFRPLKVFVL